MAINCSVVFNLPIKTTATLLDDPIPAIHSLRELTATSRPIMITAIMALTRSNSTSITNDEMTINLSATGSIKAPNLDSSPIILAKYQSSQSLIPARIKKNVARRFLLKPPRKFSGR